MNRRTVLRTAAAAVPAALSGCVDAVIGDRELQVPVTLRVVSEAEEHRYMEITALDAETGRQTYEQQFIVRAGETAEQPHLNNSEQRLRVAMARRDPFEEASITRDTQDVLVTVFDDALEIEITERD